MGTASKPGLHQSKSRPTDGSTDATSCVPRARRCVVAQAYGSPGPTDAERAGCNLAAPVSVRLASEFLWCSTPPDNDGSQSGVLHLGPLTRRYLLPNPSHETAPVGNYPDCSTDERHGRCHKYQRPPSCLF